MFSKSVCHFLIAWHAPYKVGLPHNANLWGVRYSTTNPLKTFNFTNAKTRLKN
ncbi:hypothetical protein HPHPP2B_1723 [Helicobacter pylori Hp P-2b]|uniref:Uncharacterized protein n=1 Tax=Helicobacter pylori Hp P-2 TaxID=992073 RepID=I9VUS9_HELPX|nr:hypothetical protein HPHPP2_1724 [Helicobacter pylori Hp P-2]EJC56278.1 hypothetical protein HPHPP2B_1723 [Helicobacter pylori Hp P-2b]